MELKLLKHNEFKEYLPSFNDLFSLTFEREIHPNYLEWRYLNNPTGDLLVAVAIENNKIVANYSASPVLMKYNDVTHKTALSMTTMTHPDFNGRGLFTTLAELLYEDMKKKNYSFVWGFPNNNSHGIFLKKLQWNNVYEIPTFSRDLNHYFSLKVDEKYEVSMDNTFDECTVQSVLRNRYYVIKDKDYYKWRYYNNPVNKYYNIVIKENGVLIGNLVYKVYEQFIDIVEINGLNEIAKQQLVIYLLNSLEKSTYKRINSWISNYDPLHGFLERIGFTNFAPITYFGGRVLNKCDSIENYRNWQLQMGDSDVY